MRTITIVTGNKGKVDELSALARGKLDFVMHDLDLDEIQSLNLEDIVKDKAKKAYAVIKGPVIVDDVAASLECLNGLPGPFIKFFNKQLGQDSLFKLSDKRNRKVVISCLAAYYDGKHYVLGRGSFKGSVTSPRGKNGFGFDVCVVPEGMTKTLAEISKEDKMRLSHRGKAFRELLKKLENL